MKQKLVSISEAKKLKFGDHNHYSKADINSFLEYIGKKIIPSPESNNVIMKGYEYSISGWTDDAFADKEIILMELDGKEYWIPMVELKVHKEVFKDQNIYEYNFGYVDGAFHHLGSFETSIGLTSANVCPWYKLWIKAATDNKELPKEYQMHGEYDFPECGTKKKNSIWMPHDEYLAYQKWLRESEREIYEKYYKDLF